MLGRKKGTESFKEGSRGGRWGAGWSAGEAGRPLDKGAEALQAGRRLARAGVGPCWHGRLLAAWKEPGEAARGGLGEEASVSVALILQKRPEVGGCEPRGKGDIRGRSEGAGCGGERDRTHGI